uniref:NELL2-interacting cell ontogeny regulator 1 n=1 Tax=Monodelphis domestica TaxID=13616 RepID=F7AFF2_MONDO
MAARPAAGAPVPMLFPLLLLLLLVAAPGLLTAEPASGSVIPAESRCSPVPSLPWPVGSSLPSVPFTSPVRPAWRFHPRSSGPISAPLKLPFPCAPCSAPASRGRWIHLCPSLLCAQPGRPCVDCHAFEFMQRALQDLKKTAYSLDTRTETLLLQAERRARCE